MTQRKTALVTGSGKRRIGAHVADALAERGYAVVLHYRTPTQEANASIQGYRSRGLEAMGIQADVTDEAAVQSLFRQTLDRFGRLDVLVNCAAIWERKRLEEVTAADVRRHFEANTLGTFLCAQQAGLAMVQHVDGFGTRKQKRATFHAVARPRQFTLGFKLFYDEDVDRMGSRAVHALRPRVRFVSHQ